MSYPKTTDRILIVGAGCFGLSTAYHLLQRGYKDITIIDRAAELPAVDAASTDISKIVRPSYNDPFYSELGRKAIDAWRKDFSEAYHESGCLILANASDGADSYYETSKVNDTKVGFKIRDLPSDQDLVSAFSVPTAFKGKKGFINSEAGWTFAKKAVELLMSKVETLGGRILPGKPAKSLLRRGGKTSGVVLEDGETIEADVTILAVGSWTASTFHEYDFEGKCLATGQSIACIKLSDAQAKKYAKIPVILTTSDGFYTFPPLHNNMFKMAIHGSGFTRKIDDKSTPRTMTSHAEDGLRIPKDQLEIMRNHLREYYPELAEEPVHSTRLCWYNDAPNDDFIIGAPSDDRGVFFATGGSGHALKFLPVLGGLIADILEGKATQEVQQKFSFDRRSEPGKLETGRHGLPVRPLDENDLCTMEHLKAVQGA